jgi:hypothetical protein
MGSPEVFAWLGLKLPSSQIARIKGMNHHVWQNPFLPLFYLNQVAPHQFGLTARRPI